MAINLLLSIQLFIKVFSLAYN